MKENLEKDSGSDYEDLLFCFIVIEKSLIDLLRDVVISVILVGKDIMLIGLSWLFWLLLINLDVVEKIRFEVKKIRVRSGKRVGDSYDYEEF